MSQRVIFVLLFFTISLLAFLVFFLRKKMVVYYNRCQIFLQNEKSFLVKTTKQASQVRQLTSHNSEMLAKLKKIEKTNLELKSDKNLMIKKLEKNADDLSTQKEKLERELSHFKLQTQALLRQVSKYDSEHKTIRLRYDRILEEKKNSFCSLEQKKDEEILDLSKRLKRSESRSKRVEDSLSKKLKEDLLGVEQMRRLRSRMRDYEQFYRTAMGQKKMLEERSSNMELALKLLSCWVIKEKNIWQENFNSYRLGELVALALESTEQRQLIIDEYNQGSKENLIVPSA